jgi:DNA helicase-2/ATP-dependent DNA helicase PcrA
VGRADVVLDREDGRPESLAILDYKTSTDGDIADYALQVQVYADAGRREGLDVQGAYIHDLRTSDRTSIDIDDRALAAAETTVRVAAERLRERDYDANPGTRCRTCDVRHVCASARA